MDAICIADVSLNYNEEVVLQNLNLTVAKSQKAVITGESGSGKTSLLNIIAGFVTPQKGNVTIFNEPLNTHNISSIRSGISWVPQDLNIAVDSVRKLFFFPFTFKKNIVLKPTESEVFQIFDKMGLQKELLDKSLSEISGGQKQRIIIASCYLLKKPLLILDEPTSSLDSTSKNKIIDLLYSDPKLTMVSASHDPDWIAASDPIINLDNK